MQAKMNWKENMHFQGSTESDFIVDLDVPAADGKNSKSLTPMQLIAMGVAGCTSMDVISILEKRRLDVRDFSVQVKVERRDEIPRVFTHLHFIYTVTGKNIKRKDVEFAVKLSEEKYCQGIAMMRASGAGISNEIVINEI
ncbi:MAG TPA: OsmC family protein [Anaerolineaceae bacterium]|nr:OsmC family protein [Anaerolineaceae bacterium]